MTPNGWKCNCCAFNLLMGFLSIRTFKFSDDRNRGVIQLKVLPNDTHHNFISRFDFGKLRIRIVMVARHKHGQRTGFGNNVRLQTRLSHSLHDARNEHALHGIAGLILVHDFK